VEHALDLIGRVQIIFVDAAASGPEPCAFTPVTPEPALTYTTHAMSPGAVLRVLAQIHPGPPPPAWLLAIRGYAFDLGQSLSPQALVNLDAACALIEARLEAWARFGSEANGGRYRERRPPVC
jgi:Ni,Fe-hydrogenase maturation factor